jgi:hypothetical protein
MALRLLPFRQYAEQDVINLYSNDVCNDSTDTRGNGDAGVLVKVVSGNINQGPTLYDHNTPSTISWNTAGIPHLGKDGYPIVPLKVGVVAAGELKENVLGLTLYQTALKDENGEKLLYYPQKKLETQSVLSGEAVPILMKGVVTVALTTGTTNGNSVTEDPAGWTPGQGFQPSATADGKLDSCAPGALEQIGMILATGTRTAINQPDQFCGNAGAVGHYAIIKFDPGYGA